MTVFRLQCSCGLHNAHIERAHDVPCSASRGDSATLLALMQRKGADSRALHGLDAYGA